MRHPSGDGPAGELGRASRRIGRSVLRVPAASLLRRSLGRWLAAGLLRRPGPATWLAVARGRYVPSQDIRPTPGTDHPVSQGCTFGSVGVG